MGKKRERTAFAAALKDTVPAFIPGMESISTWKIRVMGIFGIRVIFDAFLFPFLVSRMRY